jgi:hypothetical protein
MHGWTGPARPAISCSGTSEREAMLTYEDCLSLCDLDPEEIAAIAEHEHIPEIVALEMGNYLVHSDDGEPCIRRLILDDIAHCRETGNNEREQQLLLVLKHFIATHPKAEARRMKREG